MPSSTPIRQTGLAITTIPLTPFVTRLPANPKRDLRWIDERGSSHTGERAEVLELKTMRLLTLAGR